MADGWWLLLLMVIQWVISESAIIWGIYPPVIKHKISTIDRKKITFKPLFHILCGSWGPMILLHPIVISNKNWTTTGCGWATASQEPEIKIVYVILQVRMLFGLKPKDVGHHQSGNKFHWYDSCRDSWPWSHSLRIFAEESLQVFLWLSSEPAESFGTPRFGNNSMGLINHCWMFLNFLVFHRPLLFSLSLSLSLSTHSCIAFLCRMI